MAEAGALAARRKEHNGALAARKKERSGLASGAPKPTPEPGSVKGGKLGTAASATAAISRMARKSFERSPHGEILAAAAAAVGGAGGDQRAVVAAAGGARAAEALA